MIWYNLAEKEPPKDETHFLVCLVSKKNGYKITKDNIIHVCWYDESEKGFTGNLYEGEPKKCISEFRCWGTYHEKHEWRWAEITYGLEPPKSLISSFRDNDRLFLYVIESLKEKGYVYASKDDLSIIKSINVSIEKVAPIHDKDTFLYRVLPKTT